MNLPSEMLQKEAFKTLPAKEKEEYLGNLLKRILELNPDGVTISQIKEATELTYSTIWHHLEVLSCTAQCYKISKGNLDVYYPNGEVNHLNEHGDGKSSYAVSVIKSKEGKFVCIHEKRENRLGNNKVCGGIQIPFNLLDELIETLTKAK